MITTLKKSLIASSIALALGAANVEAALFTNVLGTYAWHTDSANLTMLAPNGAIVNIFSANDVAMMWDGNAYSSSSDYTGPGSVSNVTASSTTLMAGHNWTAHDIQMFTPGSYSFDTTLGGGNIETNTLSGTVGAGQFGMHMLWDWNGNNNIDMFMVFAQNSKFGSGLLESTQTNSKGQSMCDFNTINTINIIKNCLYDGASYGSAGAPTKNQTWMLASIDADGDGVMGIPMVNNSVFPGFNANINANLTALPKVPLPGAVWLFGSGLMGLVAAAHRRKGT